SSTPSWPAPIRSWPRPTLRAASAKVPSTSCRRTKSRSPPATATRSAPAWRPCVVGATLTPRSPLLRPRPSGRTCGRRARGRGAQPVRQVDLRTLIKLAAEDRTRAYRRQDGTTGRATRPRLRLVRRLAEAIDRDRDGVAGIVGVGVLDVGELDSLA